MKISDQAYNLDIANSTWVWDPKQLRFWPIVRGGAGDPAPGDPGADTGDSEGDEGPEEGKEPGGTDTDKSEEKTLTQSEVNRIVAREISKATRGKVDPKELGFDSAKSLNEWVATAKKKTEEQKSEQEKEFEQRVKEAAETARGEVLSVANERLIKAEFKLSAVKHKVQFVEDAYELAKNLDSWDVTVDEKGQVSGLTDEFFEELKEAKPYLWATGEGEGSPQDIGAGAGTSKGPKDREAELKARYPALRGGATSP